jgi:putative RNA 2'-phosphotransferase
MTNGSMNERITRSLAYMLRHQPEEFDLEIDPYGYAELSDVVNALSERLDEPIEDADVMSAIESGDRPRYEVAQGQIRALYGHSFTIDPGDPGSPPELLYVGLGSRDASRAESHGLSGGRRAFLHLALTYDDAQEMGRRVSPEYSVVTVYAEDASAAGVPFYDRQALFLSEAIPTEFIEVGEVHTDGIRRDSRGGRTRRRPGERGERRDRVQGRAGRGRDQDREKSDERTRDREEPETHRSDSREIERAPRTEELERPTRAKRPEPPARPEPTPAPKPESQGSAFGSGLTEARPRSEPREPELPELEILDSETPETPEMPETPETPEMPETPETAAADRVEPETTVSVQEEEPGSGFGAGLS